MGKSIIASVLCGLLTAGASDAQEAGTAARLGMGARPLALGGAFVAIPDDATAVYWNPAGLTSVRSTRVQLHYRRLDSAHALDSGHIVFGPPRHGLVWGLSVNVLHRSGVAADDAIGSFAGEPGAGEFSGQVSMAVLAHPNLSLGISAGPIFSSLDSQNESTTGWGGNAGLLWRQAGTSIGFAVLGATLGLGSDAAPQPYRYRLSTGISQRLGQPFLVSLQLDRGRGADPRLVSGVEWAMVPSLRLRVGMQQPFAQTDAVAVFSNGLGVQRGRFQMDYAVRYAREIAPEHLLSLRFQLGGDVSAVQPREGLPQQLGEGRLGEGAAAGAVTPATVEASPDPRVVEPVSVNAVEEAAASATNPPKRRTLPVGNDGMPTQSRPDAASLNVPSTRSVRYVVRAGVHADMDAAALEIARFYRAQIRPTLEKRGELFIVVVKRCNNHEEAVLWQTRARDAGLKCTIDEE